MRPAGRARHAVAADRAGGGKGRRRVLALLHQHLGDRAHAQQQGEQAEPPDQTIADRSAKAGQLATVQVQQAASAEVWLRNLTLSPARFLRGKFAAQDAGVRP